MHALPPTDLPMRLFYVFRRSTIMADKAAQQFVSLRAVQAGNTQLKNATVVPVGVRLTPPKPSHVTVSAVSQASKVTLPVVR